METGAGGLHGAATGQAIDPRATLNIALRQRQEYGEAAREANSIRVQMNSLDERLAQLANLVESAVDLRRAIVGVASEIDGAGGAEPMAGPNTKSENKNVAPPPPLLSRITRQNDTFGELLAMLHNELVACGDQLTRLRSAL